MDVVVEGKKREVMKLGMAYAISREEELMGKQVGLPDYAKNEAKRKIIHSIFKALTESEIEWREFTTKDGEKAIEGAIYVARLKDKANGN